MPQLGESIAEATIRDIQIAVGEDIQADQDIFQVETDKAMMEVTTPATGTIVEIVAEDGTSYAVGATLAYVETTEEEAQRAGLIQRTEEAPDSDKSDEETSSEAKPHFAIKDEDVISETEQPTVKPTVEGGLPVPVRSTAYLNPRLRHRMEELGLNQADLAGVQGSGRAGRVTVEDFEKFIAELERNKMTDASPMRIAVADSMRRSWTRPLATVTVPIIMDRVLAHRKTLTDKPGVTLYAVRALAIAIAENTAVAGRLIGQKIVHPSAIDIGFAVEVEDGVLVPVLKNADQHDLSTMQDDYTKLVQLGQERRLPPESAGTGVATVTNVGPFGITDAMPIPLPEQNLVLGLMAGRKMPHWDREKETFVPKMECNFILSFDHRILDGGAAGRLLQRVGQLLAEPEQL